MYGKKEVGEIYMRLLVRSRNLIRHFRIIFCYETAHTYEKSHIIVFSVMRRLVSTKIFLRFLMRLLVQAVFIIFFVYQNFKDFNFFFFKITIIRLVVRHNCLPFTNLKNRTLDIRVRSQKKETICGF